MFSRLSSSYTTFFDFHLFKLVGHHLFSFFFFLLSFFSLALSLSLPLRFDSSDATLLHSRTSRQTPSQTTRASKGRDNAHTHTLMDQPQPRPVAQRKRSYSTTAYSSLEDHRSTPTATSTLFSGTNGASQSTTGQQAAQPTCLLATAVGTQVLTYEFIDNGTVPPFSSSAITGAPSKQQQQQQQAPIVPGQFDGIQMSNERTTFTMASLRWSPDSKCIP